MTIVSGSLGRPVAHHAPRITPATERSAFSHRTSERTASTGLPNRVLVQRLVLPHDVVQGEARSRIESRVGAHRLPAVAIRKDLYRRRGHSLGVAGLAERAS